MWQQSLLRKEVRNAISSRLGRFSGRDLCSRPVSQQKHCPRYLMKFVTRRALLYLPSSHHHGPPCPISVCSLSTICPPSVHCLATICPLSVHHLSTFVHYPPTICPLLWDPMLKITPHKFEYNHGITNWICPYPNEFVSQWGLTVSQITNIHTPMPLNVGPILRSTFRADLHSAHLLSA